MYNNSSHYPNSGYGNTYQQYPTGYPSTTYTYQGYGQYPDQQPTLPAPPAEGSYQPGNNWSSSGYGASSQKDAVAQEMQQQKAQLTKQREDYVKKVSVLRHELEQLRIQKQDLLGDGRTSKRDLGSILKENEKLQEEIQGKMKAIQNVIEMLSSIIKDGQSMTDLETALAETETSKSSPPLKNKSDNYVHKSETPDSVKNTSERYHYVHYDTGLHWCRLCDKFPETAKDLLLHLQDKKHGETAKQSDVDSTPWHKLPAEPVLPSYEDAPTKRIPIKGLQFFISAPSWYCKLCDIWIGDLHCASHHLKSQAHFQNYENFVSQNPQWEMEWLKDREKAMERKGLQNTSDDSDQKSRKKHKDKRRSIETSVKDRKKKKRSKKRRKHSSDSSSSSSSSDSSSDNDDSKQDRSKSIRVAMRNVKKFQSIMDEDLSSKWSVLEKIVEEHKRKREEADYTERNDKSKEEATEDPLINQWMTITPTQDKDRALLDSLKGRMRQKQEKEKAKQAEIERQKNEMEREELEKRKRQEQEERAAAEEEDRQRKQREMDELERFRDKDRNQVKFKTNYRRRRSNSDGDEDNSHDKYYRDERDRDRDSRERYRRDSNSRSSYRDYDRRSRSGSTERRIDDAEIDKKKPPGPPSYKKLPFIGRMPLFKNKKSGSEDKDKKEIKKESYEPQRKTRFEPGNLPKAFIPRPDVVCFPKLSCIPPLTIPPPPIVTQKLEAPAPPKISEPIKRQEPEHTPLPPPPPKIEGARKENLSDDEVLYGNLGEEMDTAMTAGQYYDDYKNMMYSHNMYYSQNDEVPPAPPAPSVVPHSHTLPLQPPPLPPDDDLALLGICADDMAAQSF